jgi:ADP-ribose pyrophosphatase
LGKAEVRKQSKKVFDGRLLKVFKTYQKLPNGKKACLEEVRHPGAAIIVPFVNNKIVFIRQYRPVIGKYIWELPAGTLDAKETPHACAKREVTEETGYLVGKLSKLGHIYTTPGFCTEKIHVYRADCKGKRETCRDEDEIIDVRLLSKAEVRKKFQNGRINDAKTISALKFAGVL